MKTTQMRFSADYGVNQGTISQSIRDANVKGLYKIKGGTTVYEEADVVEALKAHYKHEAWKLRERAKAYDEKVTQTNIKYEQRVCADVKGVDE